MSADSRMATITVPGQPNPDFPHIWEIYRTMNYTDMWRKDGNAEVSYFETLLELLQAQVETRQALEWALGIEIPDIPI